MNNTIYLEEETKTKSTLDELIEFCTELKELIINDFQNAYKFIIENKKYISTTILLIILLQFTNVNYLGKTFEKYCGKHIDININQKGGADEATSDAESPTNNKTKPTKDQKRASMKAFDEQMKQQKEESKESKKNEERISYFEKLKGKFSSAGGYIDKIFDSVKTIFYIISIILTIAGIISLPVLIFLIITYMVIKFMLSKFIIL